MALLSDDVQSCRLDEDIIRQLYYVAYLRGCKLPEAYYLISKNGKVQIKDGGCTAIDTRSTTMEATFPVLLRTDNPIPLSCSVYYYEVTVRAKGRSGSLAVGFCSSVASSTEWPGMSPTSFGYHNINGAFYHNSKELCCTGPTYEESDVIGCGVNFVNDSVFFTKNGVYMGPIAVGKKLPQPIYPCLALASPNCQVTLNGGQHKFRFDISHQIARERTTLIGTAVNRKCTDHLANVGMRDLVVAYLHHNGYLDSARAFAQWSGKPVVNPSNEVENNLAEPSSPTVDNVPRPSFAESLGSTYTELTDLLSPRSPVTPFHQRQSLGPSRASSDATLFANSPTVTTVNDASQMNTTDRELQTFLQSCDVHKHRRLLSDRIRAGDYLAALKLLECHFPTLPEQDPSIAFVLRCHHFIDLMCRQDKSNADLHEHCKGTTETVCSTENACSMQNLPNSPCTSVNSHLFEENEATVLNGCMHNVPFSDPITNGNSREPLYMGSITNGVALGHMHTAGINGTARQSPPYHDSLPPSEPYNQRTCETNSSLEHSFPGYLRLEHPSFDTNQHLFVSNATVSHDSSSHVTRQCCVHIPPLCSTPHGDSTDQSSSPLHTGNGLTPEQQQQQYKMDYLKEHIVIPSSTCEVSGPTTVLATVHRPTVSDANGVPRSNSVTVDRRAKLSSHSPISTEDGVISGINLARRPRNLSADPTFRFEYPKSLAEAAKLTVKSNMSTVTDNRVNNKSNSTLSFNGTTTLPPAFSVSRCNNNHIKPDSRFVADDMIDIIEYGRSLRAMALDLKRKQAITPNQLQLLRGAFSLIAYENPFDSPFREFLDSRHRDRLADAVNSAIMVHFNQPANSVLDSALSLLENALLDDDDGVDNFDAHDNDASATIKRTTRHSLATALTTAASTTPHALEALTSLLSPSNTLPRTISQVYSSTSITAEDTSSVREHQQVTTSQTRSNPSNTVLRATDNTPIVGNVTNRRTVSRRQPSRRPVMSDTHLHGTTSSLGLNSPNGPSMVSRSASGSLVFSSLYIPPSALVSLGSSSRSANPSLGSPSILSTSAANRSARTVRTRPISLLHLDPTGGQSGPQSGPTHQTSTLHAVSPSDRIQLESTSVSRPTRTMTRSRTTLVSVNGGNVNSPHAPTGPELAGFLHPILFID